MGTTKQSLSCGQNWLKSTADSRGWSPWSHASPAVPARPCNCSMVLGHDSDKLCAQSATRFVTFRAPMSDLEVQAAQFPNNIGLEALSSDGCRFLIPSSCDRTHMETLRQVLQKNAIGHCSKHNTYVNACPLQNWDKCISMADATCSHRLWQK